jgi:hypothetical protein
MGNTTMTTLRVWPVLIKEVNLERNEILALWNGNAPKTFWARDGKLPWRRTDPTKKSA